MINELKQDMVCIDLGSNIGYYAVIESNMSWRVWKNFCYRTIPNKFSNTKIKFRKSKKE